jgi:hypothetical protein
VNDPKIVERIKPVLKILGSSAELLGIKNEGTVFLFNYHGLMRNRFGMAAWTDTRIRDCGVERSYVVFETGFHRRDPVHGCGCKFGTFAIWFN